MNLRKKLLLGNWKMHKSATEVTNYVQELNSLLMTNQLACDFGFAPMYLHLFLVKNLLKHPAVIVSAQDGYFVDQGAFTSAISAKQLSEDGFQWTLVGHSERRDLFGDSDVIVNQKMHAALNHGMHAVLCVGESLAQYEANETTTILKNQLTSALKNLPEAALNKIVIAYEPIWAIGTGKTATPEQAQTTIKFIRDFIKEQFGSAVSEKMRILYGGSVNLKNIESLVSQPDIDGALVGGASLVATDFVAMAKLIK